MTVSSAIYCGRVVHTRLRPRAHRLSYACYWLLVDLDELPALDGRLRIFSYNRFNLFSVWDRDYGTQHNQSLRQEAIACLADANIEIPDGRIFLLTMPRILGYGFNPLSVYFCYRANGSLAALIYEVHNTFGQRHRYLIAVDDANLSEIEQSCHKSFYVSPFMEMDLAYRFKVTPPSHHVSVAIDVSGPPGILLKASLNGNRRPLTDAGLARIFFTHPLLTAKVIAAIHWEALRLWLKGVTLTARPEPPSKALSICVAPTSIEVRHD